MTSRGTESINLTPISAQHYIVHRPEVIAGDDHFFYFKILIVVRGIIKCMLGA